jgi:hypothetical protein
MAARKRSMKSTAPAHSDVKTSFILTIRHNCQEVAARVISQLRA